MICPQLIAVRLPPRFSPRPLPINADFLATIIDRRVRGPGASTQASPA